jgi:hypothetical protein
MRGNSHVRFGGAGRGNGLSETTAPRPGPTQPQMGSDTAVQPAILGIPTTVGP